MAAFDPEPGPADPGATRGPVPLPLPAAPNLGVPTAAPVRPTSLGTTPTTTLPALVPGEASGVVAPTRGTALATDGFGSTTGSARGDKGWQGPSKAASTSSSQASSTPTDTGRVAGGVTRLPCSTGGPTSLTAPSSTATTAGTTASASCTACTSPASPALEDGRIRSSVEGVVAAAAVGVGGAGPVDPWGDRGDEGALDPGVTGPEAPFLRGGRGDGSKLNAWASWGGGTRSSTQAVSQERVTRGTPSALQDCSRLRAMADKSPASQATTATTGGSSAESVEGPPSGRATVGRRSTTVAPLCWANAVILPRRAMDTEPTAEVAEENTMMM